MSYDVHLYKKEVKESFPDDFDFLENNSINFNFSNTQFEYLKKRLLKYDFILENEENNQLIYSHLEFESVSAMLTLKALYFSATNEDDIFEIGLIASEFTDNEEFAKFDPQNEGWEEIE